MEHKVLGFVLVAGALALGLYLVTQLTLAQMQQGEDDWHQDWGVNLGEPLISLDRTGLSLCVEGTDAYSPSESLIESVQEAVEDVVAVHQDLPVQYAAPTLSAGCPPTRVPLGERRVVSPGAFSRIVDEPSEHYLFVYLVPPDVYAQTFRSKYEVGGTERVCQGDVCMLATLGLWVPSTAEPSVLQDGILEALRWVPTSEDSE